MERLVSETAGEGDAVSCDACPRLDMAEASSLSFSSESCERID